LKATSEIGNAYEDDHAESKPVFSLKWEVLDPAQRISTILGLIGGGVGAAYGIFVSAEYNPLSFIVFLPFLVPLLCSLSLLYLPMSEDKRGIMGFVTLLISLAPISFLILLLLQLVFPHRDTSTGL
jgi:hypothetical protein